MIIGYINTFCMQIASVEPEISGLGNFQIRSHIFPFGRELIGG